MAIVKATEEAIRTAGGLLRAGRLVAFPTETVYGLGADATNGQAVAAIFATKGRPRFNPLIVHLPEQGHAEEHGLFTPLARRLAEAFWPGPLTLVLQRARDTPLSDLVSAGLDSVALRVPDHAIAQALLRAAERPLAAPSANRSGRVSPTRADHVLADLDGDVALILDGGPAAHGLESTILDVRGDEPILLRAGAVPADRIAEVLGREVVRRREETKPAGAGNVPRPSAPGQLESHYAPRAKLRLGAVDVRPGEVLLAFGNEVPDAQGTVINLSQRGNLNEAAANLFAALRTLDATGAETIAVMEIPLHGIGEAINDRLARAAAPRR